MYKHYFRIGLLAYLGACYIGAFAQQAKSKNNTATTKAASTYQNPVLGGDYPDPSIMRDGKDYYMTHSSFDYYPGLLVWHSTDMIHWERIAHALNKNVGSVWAPDLVKYKDTYYIYFPANKAIYVVTAKSPAGPWSDPVNLKLTGFIDPGHMVDKDGTRYLYLSNGYVVKLAEDGLSTIGAPQHGYDGWRYPKDWATECFCMESPKSTVKNGYFYQTVAEGGTAGPATAHMVVSARAKSPYGPWENSPYNPIVHTQSRNERWWQQGHGTLVDDVAGNWWIVYHSYEKYFQTLGRQTLMLPIEWTKDNWFRVPKGTLAEKAIRKPAGTPSKDGTQLSDDFSGPALGLQWQGFKKLASDMATISNGKLEFTATGNSFANSSPLLVDADARRYQIQAEFTLEPNTTAGLTLYYNEQANMRIAVDAKQFTVYNQASRKASAENKLGNHGYMKIINDENEISFYYSANGKDWDKMERSIDATGFNHNVFGGFMSLRAGLYAFGSGKVQFDNFIYHKL